VTVATFIAALRSATFARGPLARSRSLSADTIAKHLTQLRAITARIGPTIDPKRPAKKLVAETPYLAVKRPQARPKPAFAIEAARRMLAGVWQQPRWPRQAATAIDAPRFLLATVATLYYTGLRPGTALGLDWGMLGEHGADAFLDVPAAAVTKTRKPIQKFLHAEALAAICRLHGVSPAKHPASGPLLRCPWTYGTLAKLHKRLQRRAGLAGELSLQAWRRTHGTELARLGLGRALELARGSLDHADVATTSGYYVDLEAEAIKRLPPILPADDRQGRLW